MFKLFLCLFLFLKVTGFSGKVQTEKEEYSHKALCLYYMTKYFTWEASSQFTVFFIGVLGTSTLIEPLEEIAKTKTVDGKKIIVKKFNTPDEITYCHILFISHGLSFSLEEILAKPSVKRTLIVSETPGYAARGTAINYITVNNSVKFEANLKAIKSAGLKASSQVLKLAILVEH